MFKIQICYRYQNFCFGIINHFPCVENKIQGCTDYQLPLPWNFTKINAKMSCPGSNCKLWFMGLYFEMFWSSNSLTIRNKIIFCTHFEKICITLNMVRQIQRWVLRYQWRDFCWTLDIFMYCKFAKVSSKLGKNTLNNIK